MIEDEDGDTISLTQDADGKTIVQINECGILAAVRLDRDRLIALRREIDLDIGEP